MSARLLLCLAMAPLSAAAWESPQEAIDAFLAYELAGGRLHSDHTRLARHVHLDAHYQAIGADTINVTNRHTTATPQCRGKRCMVSVRYWLPAASNYDGLPVNNGPRARQQEVQYVLRQADGQWRLDADSLSDMPYVSEAGLFAFLASQPGQMDEIEQDAQQEQDGDAMEHGDHPHD